MKDKIVEILKELGVKAHAAKAHKISSNLWDETLERTAAEIAQLYSAGEEVRACPCTYLDEPCKENCTCKNPFSSAGCEYCCSYGSIEQRKSKAVYLQKKLTRPTVSDEEAGYNEMSKIVDVLVEHISPTEEELNVTSNEGWPKYNERILKIATEIKELN